MTKFFFKEPSKVPVGGDAGDDSYAKRGFYDTDIVMIEAKHDGTVRLGSGVLMKGMNSQDLCVDVIDTDGDKIEFRIDHNNIVEYVNNQIALRNVTSFSFDFNTGKYRDPGGSGRICATERLGFAR